MENLPLPPKKPNPTPKFDHALYLKAQTRATGANIHKIKGLAQGYILLWEFAEETSWTEEFLTEFAQQETLLRAALHTKVPKTPPHLLLNPL
jgi:hypothetical protein